MSEEPRRVVDLPVPAPTAAADRHADPPLAIPATTSAEEPTLADYLDVLRANRWLIAAVAAAVLVLGGLYVLLAAPTFRADILIQVEEKSKGLGGLSELSDMLSEKTPAETEMEILRSRLLTGAVVDELGLDILVRPRRIPILGGAVGRSWAGGGPRPTFLGLSSFAWGGERIRVERLAVGEALYEEALDLVAGEGGAYTLLDPDGRELLRGEVGKPASSAGLAAGGPVELFVSQLTARPGTRFRLEKLRRGEAVEKLQRDLRISEKGKKTGIIVVALEGPSPTRVAAVLDSVARTYLRQNVERKSAEAEKTLEFVESQLPLLKDNLDRVEDRLNVFKKAKGSVDLSLETKGALDRAVEIEKGLTELSLQQQELRQRFTESHPALNALAGKRDKLLAEKAALEQRLKALPEAELDAARLMRDVKTASELYFLLLNKAQELRVVRSGTIGNVRIIDTAVVPHLPVAPRKVPTLALALLLGLAAGVAAAFVRKALDHGVDDPDVIERATGIPVYASVPHSSRQDELVRQFRRQRSRARPILAQDSGSDLAIEALRSLRTALQFSLVEARTNVIAVVGAAPGAGKSFVAVNLAHAMADAGKRVLVVDADLRKGRMHHYFAGEREKGISELVAGQLSADEAIRRSANPGVDYLSTGLLPPNPSELLASDRFKALVAQLAARYDLVLIDTAPILAVTDGAIAGRVSGVNLMVLRAGAHPLREILLAVRRFRQNAVPLHGVVLNDVKLSARSASRYAYHYQYEYRAED